MQTYFNSAYKKARTSISAGHDPPRVVKEDCLYSALRHNEGMEKTFTRNAECQWRVMFTSYVWFSGLQGNAEV